MNRLSIDPRFSIGTTLLFAVALALCVAAVPQPVAPGIGIFVDSTGDGVNTGSGNNCDDGTGHCTLRAAIQLVNARNNGGDGITISVTGTITLNSALPNLSTPVSIDGPGADQLTVQRDPSAPTNFRIFNVTSSGTVSLSGLNLAHGTVLDDNGGGIQNYNAGTVNVTNCDFFDIGTNSDNTAIAANGGGIYNRAGGTVNVTNCIVAASAGGGNGGCIYNSSTGTINVTNSTLAHSFATVIGTSGVRVSGVGNGGGVYNLGAMTVSNSSLFILAAYNDNGPNTSGSNGGGIYNAGTMTVTSSTIYLNRADTNGGGIYNADFATFNIINSTVYGNLASAFSVGHNLTFGGGIYNRGALNVSNSTISGNSTDTTGGGIYNDSQATGNVTVKSSVIANNTASSSDPDVAGTFVSQGFNLVGKNDGAATSFPAGNPNANKDIAGTSASPIDPKLDPNGPQNNGGPTQTIALLSGSPAIDKGISNGRTTDQRGVGFLRTIDDHAIPNATGGDGTDIGAFELGANVPVVSRKTHGSVGDFNIALPLSGPIGVECRNYVAPNSNTHQVIMTFPAPVTVGSASAAPDPDKPGATASVSSFTVTGAQVTVNLAGVSDADTIVVTLSSVSDGTNTNNFPVPMGVLLGDVTGNGGVTNADVSLVKAQVAAGGNVDPLGSNFRDDVNANGVITNADVSITKAQVAAGAQLP